MRDNEIEGVLRWLERTSIRTYPTFITMVNLSLYAIKAVILLDAEGNRVLSKYYGKDYASTKDQKAFEKGLFDKTKRAQGKDPNF